MCQKRRRRRNFSGERLKAILEETYKLLEVGFICKVMYLEWLTNIMMAKKASEKWCMYMDFIDINKACSKKTTFHCLKLIG